MNMAYFPHLSLTPAPSVMCPQNDYETVDYVNELREGCLEAYTGIVQGLKGEDSSGKLLSLLLSLH